MCDFLQMFAIRGFSWYFFFILAGHEVFEEVRAVNISRTTAKELSKTGQVTQSADSSHPDILRQCNNTDDDLSVNQQGTMPWWIIKPSGRNGRYVCLLVNNHKWTMSPSPPSTISPSPAVGLLNICLHTFWMEVEEKSEEKYQEGRGSSFGEFLVHICGNYRSLQ